MTAPGFDLTPREREFMAYLSARETCPTYAEAAAAMDIASKSGVYRLVRQLESKGYVARDPRRRFSLRILKRVRSRPAVDPTSIKAVPILGPVPAPWSYPFRDHRTCAQVWAEEAREAA